MTHHTQVVGANGQRQAMWIERQEGLGEVILSNFVFRAYDLMMVFSTSGANGVVVDVALGAKARGMKVVCVIAAEYSRLLPTGIPRERNSRTSQTYVGPPPPGDAMVESRASTYPWDRATPSAIPRSSTR